MMLAAGAACALPGVWLMLRRVALVADAMSHVLLLGIVVSYLLVRDLESPLLLVGAALSGVLTVALVEALQRTRLIRSDAAIGLVFPALFSLGTILATVFLRNTHLDIDRVLLGSAELSSLNRLMIGNWDVMPRGLAVLLTVLLLNLVLGFVFAKELKLATFDPLLATTLGFTPWIVHYGLMTMVSLTTVAAFDAVGPVVVVALIVVPASTAYLLSNRLTGVMAGSLVVALIASFVGTVLAFTLDTNIGGTVAVTLGGIFGITFLVAPRQGMIAKYLRQGRDQRAFHDSLLIIHLLQHMGTPEEPEESRLDRLPKHLHWHPRSVEKIVRRAVDLGHVILHDGKLSLTPAGTIKARNLIHWPQGSRSFESDMVV